VPAYFFDSSAIIKRYVEEKGSDWVVGSTDPVAGSSVYVSAITGVEVVAALARKRKANDIDPLLADAAFRQFYDHFYREYFVINITDSVIARSIERANAHALRGYDAVQLGAALEINARRASLGLATPLIFVTADHELFAAAVGEGLLTDNPNTH
jgi:predicted nucleic acid-binding protein